MYDSMMTEIAFELHKAMPKVMKDHHFKEMWSYKYESSSHDDEARTGIHVHADDGELFDLNWVYCCCLFVYVLGLLVGFCGMNILRCYLTEKTSILFQLLT